MKIKYKKTTFTDSKLFIESLEKYGIAKTAELMGCSLGGVRLLIRKHKIKFKPLKGGRVPNKK